MSLKQKKSKQKAHLVTIWDLVYGDLWLGAAGVPLKIQGFWGVKPCHRLPDSHPDTLSPSVLLSSSHSNGSLFSVWSLPLSISLGI